MAKRLRVGAGFPAIRSVSKRSLPAPVARHEPAVQRKGKRCRLPNSASATTLAVADYTGAAAEPSFGEHGPHQRHGDASPLRGVCVPYATMPTSPGAGLRSTMPPLYGPWQPFSSPPPSGRARPSVPDLILPPKLPPKPDSRVGYQSDPLGVLLVYVPFVSLSHACIFLLVSYL